jgi:hypothetical protein
MDSLQNSCGIETTRFVSRLKRSNGVSDFVGFDASTSEMTPFFPKNAAAREVALIYLEVISGNVISTIDPSATFGISCAETISITSSP